MVHTSLMKGAAFAVGAIAIWLSKGSEVQYSLHSGEGLSELVISYIVGEKS